MSDDFTRRLFPAPLLPGTQRATRRGFLRSAGLAGSALALTGLIGGCATGGARQSSTETTAPSGPVDPKNPFGVAAGTLTAVVFDGGDGVEHLNFSEKLFEQTRTETKIEITRTQDLGSLQSQFVNQTPPDLFQNSGAKALDATALTLNEQLAEIEDLMASPSWDDPLVTVEASLSPSARLAGVLNGSMVGFNFVQYAWGLWHDSTLFSAKGWEMPGTWEDLMALCTKIKAADIHPWAFTGVHTNYFESGVYVPLVSKIGGQGIWKAVDNLEDGAWRQPAIRQAAEAMVQLRTDKFILPGVAQMTHIQSQTAWLQHKAAFIPVGAWLENEMRSTIPEGFALTATSVPGPGGQLTDLVPNNAGASWYIPAQAKNPGAAKEFLRTMVSKEAARNFAKLTNNVTIVKGAHDDQDLGPALNSVTAMIKKSEAVEAWDGPQFGSWYKSLVTESRAALMALLLGDLTVDGYLDRCQKKADEVKKDKKIKKITR